MTLVKNKRIVFVINSLEGGGAEKVLCNWLREMEAIFIESNAQVTLVLLDDLPEKNTCPQYVNKITLDSSGKLIKSYFNLRQALLRLKPDVILSFLTRSNFAATIVGKQLGVKTLISERVNTSQHFDNSIKGHISKVLVKYLYPKATKIFAVSGGVKNDLVKNFAVEANNCDVIYNAYDPIVLHEKANEVLPNLDLSKPYAVAIGRLQPNKNFELMLEAYAKAKITIPLLILGEGPQMSALQNRINDLCLEKQITLKGYQNNPYPYLLNAEFLVSTSNAEGFPNGIAESLTLGTPVLATNCESGPAEILANDVNFKTETAERVAFGVLCKPKSIAGVVKGFELIQTLTGDKAYSQTLKERAKIYSFERVRNKLVCELNSVLEID